MLVKGTCSLTHLCDILDACVGNLLIIVDLSLLLSLAEGGEDLVDA
jgi:hypothetical protein